MDLQKTFASLILVVFVTACSSNQSKLESILDRNIGKAKLIAQTRLELDSTLGKQESKLKSSVIDFLSDRVEIKYKDVLVEGRRARVTVVATVPKMDEVAAILMLASFLPREKMLSMSIQDVLEEVSKSSRRPASDDDIKNETYEFSVDFEKGKDWVADSEQLKKAYTKRNLISKR
ncbi:hypothetical protein K2P97_04740 [bacterium]|nr:hypothetical protein [bacterium]